MTENTTTDEYVYKYKNDQSTDDNNNSTILLNQYQSFILDDYSFIVGTTDNDSIYIECKQNEKFYKKIISKKNCYVINDKFQSCKTINEIYKLIVVSITKNQININNIKNNKIKFSISIGVDDTTPSYFEIILKEEKNKNDAIIYKLEKKNNEDALLKENENNEENSDLQKDNSDSIFMEDFKKDILANYKQNRSVGSNKPDNAKKEKKEEEKKDNNNNGNILDFAEEEEEEEEEDNDDDNAKDNNVNKENQINNVLEIINNLKTELLFLKNAFNKNGQNNNEEKIKELETKNNSLVEEITKIKNDLKILFEENKKAKEEINILKKTNINSSKESSGDMLNSSNNSEEENNTIREIMGITNNYGPLTKTVTIDETRYRLKNSSKKSKRKKAKSKSQRKSIVFNSTDNEDEYGSLNVFIFKQKYNIKENDIELDLTNKRIGDRGLEALTRVQFQKLKSLSLDNNALFVIKCLSNFYLNELEILNLDNNNISDISILENVKFPSLKVLWLNNNNISDISVLERVKLNQLQHLYLNNNNISDISVLKKTYLNKLERLYLKNNKIEDISCLDEIDLKKLQLIYLNKNRIDFNLRRNKEIIKKLKKKIKYLSY